MKLFYLGWSNKFHSDEALFQWLRFLFKFPITTVYMYNKIVQTKT